MLMTLPLTLLRSPRSRSSGLRVEKSRNCTRCFLSFTRCPPSLFVHCYDDLADLRVAQHVSVRVGNSFEWESSVEHRLECAAAECPEQVSGEALTAYQGLFQRAGAECHADNAYALARYFIEI